MESASGLIGQGHNPGKDPSKKDNRQRDPKGRAACRRATQTSYTQTIGNIRPTSAKPLTHLCSTCFQVAALSRAIVPEGPKENSPGWSPRNVGRNPGNNTEKKNGIRTRPAGTRSAPVPSRHGSPHRTHSVAKVGCQAARLSPPIPLRKQSSQPPTRQIIGNIRPTFARSILGSASDSAILCSPGSMAATQLKWRMRTSGYMTGSKPRDLIASRLSHINSISYNPMAP